MTDLTKLKELRNLDAYYYSFQPSGSDEIDAVLEAVAWAGHGWHNTEDWNEDYGDGDTAIQRIQRAAGESAAKVNALIAEVERLRGKVEAYEEGMRSLACNLGAGGYNADTLTAVQLVDKVQWGVDNLAETQNRLLDEVRTENTALRKTAERYRELRKITPHRFKKLQEAATTDGGDVFYFHADRFDAALDAALEGGGR